MSVVLTGLSIVNIQQLGERNVDDFTGKVVELRRGELKNYTQLAISAVKHIYENASSNDDVAQEMAKSIFRDLRYGDDGYFFVYDYEGNNIVHPQKTHLEGRNLWYLRDSDGTYIIRSLVREAKNDLGGYTQYIWEKPSLGREVDKLGFSMGLNDWRWMVGTGLYMDDVGSVIRGVEETVDNNTQKIALITIGISLFFTFCVATVAIRFTMTQSRFASHKLQKLSRSCIHEREIDRSQLANTLNTDIAKKIVDCRREFKDLMLESESLDDVKSSSSHLISKLNNLLGDVGLIADGLHPKILIADGLYAAIDALSNRLSKSSGISINVTGVNALERLELDVETACYRIVQEAFENIILHSSASEVSVRMRQTRSVISLIIQDDGVGFDPDQLTNLHDGRGAGLSTMELHAELLGGGLTLFSAEGTGTMIKITIPLTA
jgi:two-component system NarL family sensor kinase